MLHHTFETVMESEFILFHTLNEATSTHTCTIERKKKKDQSSEITSPTTRGG